MNEILDEELLSDEFKKKRVYKSAAIWVGTFLGGPLVAGYFISENFKIFQQNDKIGISWGISIFTTFIITILVLIIPEDSKIPNQLIPIIYTSIAYSFFKQFQGAAVDSHIAKGGESQSWLRIIIMSIIGLLITSALLIGSILLLDPIL